ncbi:hypothetical protein CS022_04195 [Veronia nyctiphanis]|uniref:Uncharacterized protein n=1 Tax=Veronia nyctiphanis TaxID=1278244 RepID=A0A4Q0YSP3_9GAMM|nr:hypothetical protein [Veronia nyctiphanis]RXJ74267.1 hypothetical protein CS022_04195 [Veronia nyctiphanis]
MVRFIITGGLLAALTLSGYLVISHHDVERNTNQFPKTQADDGMGDKDGYQTPAIDNQVRQSIPFKASFPRTIKEADNESHPLSSAEGKALLALLKDFWFQCELREDCEQSLNALEIEIDPSLFVLVGQYPYLSTQWKKQQAELVVNSSDDLASKVNAFKDAAAIAWGEYAERILADQYAYLDYQLESDRLRNELAMSPDTLVTNIISHVDKWQAKEKNNTASNGVIKYEKAEALIPESLTDREQETFRSELANHYLTPAQRYDIHQDNQRRQQQTIIVEDYQTQLARLKAQLNTARLSQYAHLSDDEWQAYYQDKIRQFRQQFFG